MAGGGHRPGAQRAGGRADGVLGDGGVGDGDDVEVLAVRRDREVVRAFSGGHRGRRFGGELAGGGADGVLPDRVAASNIRARAAGSPAHARHCAGSTPP